MLRIILLVCYLASLEAAIPDGPWNKPPPLPAPTGTVVTVEAGNAADLQSKVRSAASGTTILIPAGTYALSSPLRIGSQGQRDHISLRGATGDRDDVVIHGPGMAVDSRNTVPHCIMVENAQDVLIADLSIGDVWYHPITLQGQLGTQRVQVYNCRLYDAGEQFLKSNPGVDGSLVEYCLFEFTNTSRWFYTEGIDVHDGADWIVRHNVFRNIRGPEGDAAVGGAIDFWRNCRDTIVEGNLIWNCRIGIRLGMVDSFSNNGLHDHERGIVRNNIIYRAAGAVRQADIGISIADSPGTLVMHNTVVLEDSFQNAGGPACIEYRWSTGLTIANNLSDGAIWQRNDASATLIDNETDAGPAYFVDMAAGDLRLTADSPAIDAGSRLAAVPDDYEGDARHIAADLGADEYNASDTMTRRISIRVRRNGQTVEVVVSCDAAEGRADEGNWIFDELPSGDHRLLLMQETAHAISDDEWTAKGHVHWLTGIATLCETSSAANACQ